MAPRFVTPIALFAVLITWYAVPPPPATAAPEVIRLTVGAGHPLAGSAWVMGVRDVFIPSVDRALAKSGRYKIEWTQAYGGSVAKLGNVLEAVEDGVLDIGIVNYPFEAAKLFPHNFTYKVPFGTCDRFLAQRVATKLHHQFPQLTEIVEKYKQKWLGTMGSSCYGVVASFPWKGFADLKGRKIGAAGPNLPWVTAAGAVGVATTLNLAYTSLQTGVYDALIIFVDPVGGFKLYEPAKHWIEAGFGSVAPIMLSVNTKRFNALPRDVQDAVVRGGEEWGVGATKIGADLAESVTADLRKQGVAILTAFPPISVWLPSYM